MVVQFYARKVADHRVKESARNDLMPRIMARFLPSADDVETFVHESQEIGNFVRIVLQVGVHRHDEGHCRGVEPDVEGGGLPEVSSESERADSFVFARQLRNDRPARVCRTVVDKQELDLRVDLFDDLANLRVKRFETLFFIVNGNDDRKLRHLTTPS